MSQVLMPKATAVWLVENTTLTFDQISTFTGLHALEVQAIAETVPGYEMVGWTGLLVPAKTPKDVRDAINRAAVSVLNTSDIEKRLEGLGYIVMSTRPEEMDVYVKGEIEKYAQLIRRLDLSLH